MDLTPLRLYNGSIKLTLNDESPFTSQRASHNGFLLWFLDLELYALPSVGPLLLVLRPPTPLFARLIEGQACGIDCRDLGFFKALLRSCHLRCGWSWMSCDLRRCGLMR